MLAGCFLLLSMASCYQQQQRVKTPFEFTERQLDSLTFLSSHHYTNNFNFVVSSDSLVLQRSTPSEVVNGQAVDSFAAYRGAHLVVADIRQYPKDDDERVEGSGAQGNVVDPDAQTPYGVARGITRFPSDSVWVELANDTSAFGWVRETELMQRAQPDDPISAFISNFSDVHRLIFLGIIAFFSSAYLLRSLTRRKAHIVHLNDIPSFYPTLLCLLVAFSASLYAGIQTFVPQMWQHFYFHPTLNPFSVPVPLNIFLCTVWAMLVVAIAAADDVRKQLPPVEAMLYLGGLAAVVAICYIVFSVASFYFVGYILLVLYAYYALRQYFKHSMARYRCGRCGAKLQRKGRCPVCGALNE